MVEHPSVWFNPGASWMLRSDVDESKLKLTVEIDIESRSVRSHHMYVKCYSTKWEGNDHISQVQVVLTRDWFHTHCRYTCSKGLVSEYLLWLAIASG